MAPDRVDDFGGELKREASIATNMLMRADVLVPRVADQNRSSNEIKAAASGLIAKTPFENVKR